MHGGGQPVPHSGLAGPGKPLLPGGRCQLASQDLMAQQNCCQGPTCSTQQLWATGTASARGLHCHGLGRPQGWTHHAGYERLFGVLITHPLLQRPRVEQVERHAPCAQPAPLPSCPAAAPSARSAHQQLRRMKRIAPCPVPGRESPSLGTCSSST